MEYPLRELLAVDERQALEFFVTGLDSVSSVTPNRQELLYNASVLAHYTLVSTQSTTDIAAPVHLGSVFDQFVLDDTVSEDPQLLETAAAQCLLLTGFFEDQMRRRHNVVWYSQLGSSFFSRAAARETSSKKAALLDSLSRHFEPWRRRHAKLGRELRDLPYLLQIKRE